MLEYHKAYKEKTTAPMLPTMIWLDKHWHESTTGAEEREPNDIVERRLARSGMTQDGLPLGDGRSSIDQLDDLTLLERAKAAMTRLDERERQVLELRLQDFTLEEVGKQLGGLSRERVRKIEEAAIKRLRKRLRQN
jgi:RNA polymerase sigma factor (sigma-70 family)